MKNLFAIGLFVALGNGSHAQSPRADTGLVRSLSGQFMAHGLPETPPFRAPAPPMATNANYVRLEPALLAVSSERIKQALVREIGDLSPWRGKIHLHPRLARDPDERITIVSEQFRDGWSYRLDLPQFVERQRFVRAIVQVLLMELANRNAGDHAAEIPAWLTEGLTQDLLEGTDVELIPPETRWAADGQAIGPTTFDIRRSNPRTPEPNAPPAAPIPSSMRVISMDPLEQARRSLREHPPLTLAELSWPTNDRLSGEAGDVYRHSARVFVTELLRLPNGRQSLRTMLDELARCYNWQTAFFRAFEAHFARQLDLEKWWQLQVVNFTGRDTSRLWSVAETWQRLDEIVRTPAQVRHAPAELPGRADVPVQTIIKEWEGVEQTPALQTKLRDLELLRLNAAPEFVGLIEDYRKVLGSYLRRRDQVGLILTSTTRDTNAKLKILARETMAQLDALDVRRAALKPTDESASPGLAEGKPPPAP